LKSSKTVSRAKVVLTVSGTAVVTELIVSTPGTGKNAWILENALECFLGVLEELGLGAFSFDAEIKPIGAFSDFNNEVIGYSLDIAAFTCLVGCILRIQPRKDTLCTGWISTTDGDIGHVHGLVEKLHAAELKSEVTHFVCPSDDGSIAQLRPTHSSDLSSSIRRSRLQVHKVSQIHETVPLCFSNSEVLGALFENSLFGRFPTFGSESVSKRILSSLGAFDEASLWSTLTLSFDTELFSRYLEYLISKNQYPKNFHRNLAKAVASNNSLAISIDHELIEKIQNLAPQSVSIKSILDHSSAVGLSPQQIIDSVISQLSPKQIAAEVLSPIDEAHNAFTYEIQISNPQDFDQVICSYYLGLTGNPDRTEAMSLLERSFKGGYVEAWAEAKRPTQGGMRFVISEITDKFIREKVTAHALALFTKHLDPLDWDVRIACIRCLFNTYRDFIPSDFEIEPIERFCSSFEKFTQIIKLFVESIHSLDRFIQK